MFYNRSVKKSFIPLNYMAMLTAPMQPAPDTPLHQLSSRGPWHTAIAWLITFATLIGVGFVRIIKLLPEWWPAILLVGVLGVAFQVVPRPYTATYTGEEPVTELGIFGGTDGRTYLGCLNCSARDVDSILNPDSPYANPSRPDSMFNHKGRFGASVSATSPCDAMAYDPPYVVDSKGNVYGTLTVNPNDPDGFLSAKDRGWFKKAVCGD